jgi:hypothetical protein
MKMRLLATIAAVVLLAAACTKSAPPATADTAPAAPAAAQPATVPDESGAGVADAIAPPDAPLPPPAEDAGATSEPAAAASRPSIAVGEPNPGAPMVVDASCHTDADCAIKDVGSCCGYAPACVNKASPTFPEQVQAKCAKDGRVGICGFPAITGCTCNAGKCEGTGADADPRNRIQ